jgi:hypothetical protein
MYGYEHQTTIKSHRWEHLQPIKANMMNLRNDRLFMIFTAIDN